jgi:conjugative relaxase-like TrwC/TraI family protein
MLTISKPLSASHALAYHREEFANAQANYYTEGETIRSKWHGRLADQWGLRGEVEEEQFSRLANGQHPITGEQLVRRRTALEYMSPRGVRVRTMEHRAGWDATFSAPKSVSLTALVGGDQQVRQAHRESVWLALDELEKYVQARLGANNPAETTGKWVTACFEHDSARPVDGYAAPHLHTHVVFFNVTETGKGKTRALQPRELYRSGQYATAIYRSELALRLKRLGYEIEHGKSHQPEIKGYAREYLEASSPRWQQIKEQLEQLGLRSAAAAQVAFYQTREGKLPAITHEQMRDKHREIAARFGNHPECIVREALQRSLEELKPAQNEQSIESALNYVREKNFERQAVVDERELMRDSLRRSMGHASFAEVRDRFEKRIESGNLIERYSRSPARAFTTKEMIAYELDTIAMMRAGKNQHETLVASQSWREVEDKQIHLATSQRAAIEQILSSQDKITGLEGVADAGKTSPLPAIREAAEADGYQVLGLASTSPGARKLAVSGIESATLQQHLRREVRPDSGQKRLYVLDESSLMRTKQVNELLHRLGEGDRILLVRDTQDHEAVKTGRVYHHLREAGMQTAHLGDIVQPGGPVVEGAVERIARSDVFRAVEDLDRHNRVHEVLSRTERLAEMAREYLREPKAVLAISPDNESRRELNALIRRETQERGNVSQEQHKLFVLDSQEITGSDRQWAAQYEVGDVVRYKRGSKVLGIDPGEYASVKNVDATNNLITIERANGECQTYDPRRLSGVTVYREVEREFSVGDRVQFTAPSKDLHVVNRELGTIEKMNDAGDIKIRMDSGRAVALNIREHPHLDLGYAVPSHIRQGQTAERVLIDVDTEKSEQLVTNSLAHVLISCGRYEVQIYTNDRNELARDPSFGFSRRTATESQEKEPATREPSSRHEMLEQEQEHTQGIGFGMAD